MQPGDETESVPYNGRYGGQLAGELVVTDFESRCLKSNPLGDPTRRQLMVYLPPGYDGTKRFPVVLMLPAFGSSHRSALGYNPWKPNTAERLDRQIRGGECAPVILALPDGMTRWGGSQYVDSAAMGNYQTYIAEEVFAHLDATFRTIPEAGGRAAVGRSSGGFGALRLAMDRPGVVSAVASHAGDAHFEVSMRPMLTGAAVAFHQAGGIRAFMAQIDTAGPKSSTDFDGLFVLASSAAYAPNHTLIAPYCDLPINERGEVVEAIWQRWLAHDPLHRIEDSQTALRSLRLVFLDAGDGDEHGLQFAAAALASKLTNVGVSVQHEEHPGGHRGTSWRYERSLPLVAELLQGS